MHVSTLWFVSVVTMLTNYHLCIIDSASADDPNEISFTKGEVLDIVDKQGKWWQAKKSDGTIGSTSPRIFCMFS
jgi:hypothetical protein